jgi:26S proteasome regulatory subunit N1
MLKEKLEILVERLTDHDQEQREFALTEITKEVQGATSTITSVPKPLKFMSEQYKKMVEVYES